MMRAQMLVWRHAYTFNPPKVKYKYAVLDKEAYHVFSVVDYPTTNASVNPGRGLYMVLIDVTDEKHDLTLVIEYWCVRPRNH